MKYGAYDTIIWKLQESSIQYLLDKGAEPYKLILGIPFYGRSFKLADPDKNTPGSEAKGAGEPGPFLNSAGYLAYYEVPMFI